MLVRIFRRAVVASVFVVVSSAHADMAPPSGVVALTASASVEVSKDMMNVTLSVARDGPDAIAIQTALKQALDAALAEARRVAKPGQVELQTGQFALYPRTTNKGLISGWQGTAELIVEGRDMPAIAQLVGRISTMTVARVGYTLSRELREKNEGEVAAQAIARYRANAADHAKAFGYGAYSIREVNVTANEPPPGVVPMFREKAMAASDSAPLPVEAGKATVMVTVAGTVQMLK